MTLFRKLSPRLQAPDVLYDERNGRGEKEREEKAWKLMGQKMRKGDNDYVLCVKDNDA